MHIRFKSACPSSGFSMIEVMIVVVVIAILARLAIPSLTRFLDESARSQAAAEFMASMARARSQALTSGASVFVCPRASTADNTPGCATTNLTDWSNGLYVFVMTPTGTNPAVLNEDQIIWEYAPSTPNVTITQYTESGNTLLTPPLSFSSVGSLKGANGTGGSFALWRICRARGGGREQGSVAVVQSNGGASLEKTAPLNQNNPSCLAT